jgi:TfoX/Sxy family transcriptional regulator of competence genes
MKKNISYHDFIIYDLMGKLPEISSKPMMSGWCIYSEKVPFAAIIGNQVYLKAKREMADKLCALGWQKFEYKKPDGKIIHMNYWQVPDELIDNQEEFTKIAMEVLDFLSF